MSILRKHQRSNFSVIQNDILEDQRLTYRARGIAAFILAKPDGWDISIASLAAPEDVEGQDAIGTAMGELATLGYLMRRRERNEWGQLSNVTYLADYPAFVDQGTPKERIQGYTEHTNPVESKGLVDGGLLVNTISKNISSFSKEKEDLPFAEKQTSKAAMVRTPKQVEPTKKQPRKRKPKQLAFEGEFTPNEGQTRRDDGAIIPSQPEMYKLVCKICGIDWDVIRGTSQEKNVGKVASNLRKAGYTEEELRRWWVEVWKQDYRSKNDGKPTPNLLLQLVGKLIVRPLVEEK